MSAYEIGVSLFFFEKTGALHVMMSISSMLLIILMVRVENKIYLKFDFIL